MNHEGAYRRLLDEADAHQLPALVADWAGDRALRCIARALRLDLALLTAYPELAMPCLARRFVWVGTAEESAFYAKRPPLDPDYSTARIIVEDWLRAWSPGQRWLRALRPPELPIDSPVVEEYRTDRRGPLAIDEERIGIAGTGTDTGIAWDRETGRVDPPPLAAPLAATTAWRLADWPERKWGRLVIYNGDRRVQIDHDDNESIDGIRPLGGGLLLASCTDVDAGDQILVIDPDAGRIVWRSPGSCYALVERDNTIVMATDRGIEIRVRSTGDLRACIGGLAPEAIAVSPSGTVATRRGSVIRVWNLLDASRWGTFEPHTVETFVTVQWSPDEQRLLTSQLLCDAIDGHAIASLDLNGPRGWLEGGPPRDCQRLVEGTVVEVLPWRFTMWDTESGEQVHVDDARAADSNDTVAFDPTGRYHAIYRERTRRLTAYGLLGDILFQRDGAFQRPRLGFTADGERLLVEDGEADERLSIALPAGTIERHDADLPWEPAPGVVNVRGGILEFGGATIACDDDHVIVSPSAKRVASRHSHYVVVDDATRSSTTG